MRKKDQAFYFFRMLDPDFTPMPVYAAMKAATRRQPMVYPGYFQEDHWAIERSGAWVEVAEAGAVLGKYRRSDSAGDSLRFTFTGSRLDMVFARGPGKGTVTVTVDERAPVELSLDAAAPTFGTQTTIASGLAAGSHRVLVTVVTPGAGVDGLVVYR